jgi:hypothetical protein
LEGYPPVAKSAEALILQRMNDPTKAYALIHGQSPCLRAEVPAFAETFRAGVSARRRGLLRRRIKFPEDQEEQVLFQNAPNFHKEYKFLL